MTEVISPPCEILRVTGLLNSIRLCLLKTSNATWSKYWIQFHTSFSDLVWHYLKHFTFLLKWNENSVKIFFFLQELVDDMCYDIDFLYSYTVRMPLPVNESYWNQKDAKDIRKKPLLSSADNYLAILGKAFNFRERLLVKYLS